MGHVEDAFYKICVGAEPARSSYVSLYRVAREYIGPEEGGRYSNDHELVSYFEAVNSVAAQKIYEQVQTYAKQLSVAAKLDWARTCRNSLEEAELRGIDPDELPEVDDADEFYVVVESVLGSNNSVSPRQYE
jgi:hypothetical protein